MISKLFPLLVLTLAGAAAQTPENEILALLQGQAADWNRGDVRAFMKGYAGDTVFVGDKVTRGSAEVLERYLKKYPTRESMGRLTFSDIEVRILGPGYASVIGRFHLERTSSGGGDTGGIYTLLLRKMPAGWRIILDHTS